MTNCVETSRFMVDCTSFQQNSSRRISCAIIVAPQGIIVNGFLTEFGVYTGESLLPMYQCKTTVHRQIFSFYNARRCCQRRQAVNSEPLWRSTTTNRTAHFMLALLGRFRIRPVSQSPTPLWLVSWTGQQKGVLPWDYTSFSRLCSSLQFAL